MPFREKLLKVRSAFNHAGQIGAFLSKNAFFDLSVRSHDDPCQGANVTRAGKVGNGLEVIGKLEVSLSHGSGCRVVDHEAKKRAACACVHACALLARVIRKASAGQAMRRSAR